MADAASIGASFSDYRGDAGLGQIDAPALNIDTRPMQELAYYTSLYNKNVWDKNVEDTNAKVKQLADLSNIHLNDLRGKDKDYMSGKWVDFLNYASDFAKKQPKTPEEKLQQQLEWQTKYGQFMNDFDSGKQRAIAYQAHLNTIQNNTTNPARRDEQLGELNKMFDDTEIGTPLSALPQYKLTDITVPDPINQKFDLLQIGGDQNIKTAATIFNPSQNTGSADAAVLGVSQEYLPKTIKDANGNDIPNPEYEKLSDSEKQRSDQQATVDSQAKLWNDMATPLNQVLQQKGADGKLLYYDENGNFNEEKFLNDNASNSVVMRAYKGLKSLSDYSKDMYNQSANGMFTDKGLQYKLPANVNANDFKAGIIDFSKPITPNQLVLAGIFSRSNPNTFEKTVTETGKATGLEKERMTQAGENARNAANIAKDKYIANLKLPQTDANGNPLDFGNLIYGVNSEPKQNINIDKKDGTHLTGLKIKGGVVIDKDGNVVDYTGDLKIPASYLDNSIITEFNKYAGSSKTDAQGNTVSNPPTKLLLENGKYTVRMVNGQIQGIQTENPDEGSPDKGGSFASADQFQHITLEAGQKSATKYKKPDTNIGKFDKTKTQPLTDAEKYLESLKKK